jgi:Lrp/AsnC family transcriptional regulator for asnA, asnC and gidA
MEEGSPLDNTDIQILKVLSEDARASNTYIAKRLGFSEGTVRKRIKRMRDEDLIRILCYGDPTKLGFPIAAMIRFHVLPKALLATAEALTNMEETDYVALTTGSSDIVVRCAFRSDQGFIDFLSGPIAQLEGIVATETHLLLKIMKRTFSLFSRPTER